MNLFVAHKPFAIKCGIPLIRVHGIGFPDALLYRMPGIPENPDRYARQHGGAERGIRVLRDPERHSQHVRGNLLPESPAADQRGRGRVRKPKPVKIQFSIQQ